MKTIEQKAREYADLFCERCMSRNSSSCAPTKDRCRTRRRMIEDFLAGAKATTEWQKPDTAPVNELVFLKAIVLRLDNPLSVIYGVGKLTENGDWSDEYGREFDELLLEIKGWRPIELP